MNSRIISYCDRAIGISLCLLIFCLPFAKAGVESFTWIAFFAWILKRILGYRGESLWGMSPKTKLNTALGIFIAVNALSTLPSVNLGLSLRGFFGKELKFLAIYFMLVEFINSKERLRNILTAIIASAALITIDAGAQYFFGMDFLRGHRSGRLSASFSSANGFACWIIVIIPLFLGLLQTDKSIKTPLKALVFILVGLLFVCLLATYTRGAWLGLAIGISFMAGFVFLNFKLKIKLLCLVIIAGFLVAFLTLPKSLIIKFTGISKINFKYPEPIAGRINSTLRVTEQSISIRIKLWNEALKIIKDYNNPVGCGLNTYSVVARNYKSFELGGMYPHNSYLQMTAEIGWLGLLAFLGVIFMFFKTGLQYFNQRKDTLVLGLLSGMLAFLIHAFFDTHLYSLQLVVLFWYMLGLTIAAINVNDNMPLQKI